MKVKRYKVVSFDDHSCFVPDRSDLSVEYRSGRKAVAPRVARKHGYGLCVFETREQAEDFLRNAPATGKVIEVWVCARSRMPLPRYICGYRTAIDSRLFAPFPLPALGEMWPLGTEMYPAVWRKVEVESCE